MLLGLYVLYVIVVANSHRISPVRWGSETSPLLPPAAASGSAQPTDRARRGSVNDSTPRLDDGQTNFFADACVMTDWAERSAFERVLYVLEAPFRVARIVTIPTFIAPEQIDEPDAKAGRTMADMPVLVNCPEKVAIAASSLGFPCLVTLWVQAEVLDDDFETLINGAFSLISANWVCEITIFPFDTIAVLLRCLCRDTASTFCGHCSISVRWLAGDPSLEES